MIGILCVGFSWLWFRLFGGKTRVMKTHFRSESSASIRMHAGAADELPEARGARARQKGCGRGGHRNGALGTSGMPYRTFPHLAIV